MTLRPKIALYEPDIPQNTAAIIRTCACLGAGLEIIEPCGFLFNDKRFKRVVMDYMDEKLIKFYQSSEEFFKSKKGQRVILLTTKSAKPYTTFKFEINDTLLFGRESAGVPDQVHNSIKYRLKIPMMNNKRSLNIASSVAIILSENLRQTNFNK
ncbi:tRNA (cytidine(34)-2'-O)-methyltransferase [Candidatus Pelagibacter sp. Uisw_099_02]|uniref:tRNA (cytidine(34)-2'-O)-methyltransferase n=1 Tax=Candidatus Pelagibacter sp. Uisw_099_02 TaxID=3230981 RepID=UPI0039E7D86D